MAKTAAKSAKKAKPAAAAPAMKINPTDKARTKSQILNELASMSGLGKKEVTSVLASIEQLVHHDLGKKGPGLFTLPNLLKLKRVEKPATKQRKGINPFTKEEITIKAKPARRTVRATAVKKLKDAL